MGVHYPASVVVQSGPSSGGFWNFFAVLIALGVAVFVWYERSTAPPSFMDPLTKTESRLEASKRFDVPQTSPTERPNALQGQLGEVLREGAERIQTTLRNGSRALRKKVRVLQRPNKPGERREHTVRPGESLWTIAKQGQLVDAPWQWRTVMVQNPLAIRYAIASEDTGEWTTIVEPGQKLTVRSGLRRFPLPDGPRYTAQLVAMPSTARTEAMAIVRRLLAFNHPAYLYRAQVGNQRYHRVRVGFFGSRAAAEAAARSILARHADLPYLGRHYWITKALPAEQRGELLQFGVQLVNPWCLELSRHETHAEALKTLERLRSTEHFAYISQMRDAKGRFVYRVRVGYFPSQAAARKMLNRRFAKWRNVRIVRPQLFEELLPGQHLRL